MSDIDYPEYWKSKERVFAKTPLQLIDWQQDEKDHDLFYLTIADRDGEELSTITHRCEMGFALDDDVATAKVTFGHDLVTIINNAALADTLIG